MVDQLIELTLLQRICHAYSYSYFQDKNLLLGQLELRQKLFWQIGMTVLGSAGQVAERIGDFKMDRWNYAGGAGLRYQFDKQKKVNIRLDYAIGKQSRGFYLSFNKAF